MSEASGTKLAMHQDRINDWHRLGLTSAIATGAVLRRRIDGTDLALYNIDGEFIARLNRCGECGRALTDGVLKGRAVACAGCGEGTVIADDHGRSGAADFPVMVVDDEIFVLIENDAGPSRP